MAKVHIPDTYGEDTPCNTKCCKKCAFRVGSPERSQGSMGYLHAFMGWWEGRDGKPDPFYCHEGVPGHDQEVRDEQPRYRLCAGWNAHRKTNFAAVAKLWDRQPSKVAS